MNLKLNIYPSEILRKQCIKVEKERFGSEELSQKVKEMFKIMQVDKGIGLAAPQAGIIDHIFVIDLCDAPDEEFAAFDLNNNKAVVQKKPLVCINSQIEFKSKEMHASKEGCLSLPGILVYVNRPKVIRIRFWDENDCEFFYEMDNLLAKCAQHELDHLNGKMIIDYKNFIMNNQAAKKQIDQALMDLEKKCKNN